MDDVGYPAAGLSFSNGTISGKLTAAGTASNLVVRVTDAADNATVSNPFSIVVSQPLSVAGTPTNFATVSVAYSATLTAAGGDGSYSWDIASGLLPNGLTLANGIISVKLTSAGTWSNIVVRVTDGNGRTAQSAAFSITIYKPVSMSGTLISSAKVGTAYSSTVYASGGTGSYTWSIASGSLPSGLTLSGGKVSGTPTKAGTWSVILRATDGHGRIGQTGAMSITVSPSIKREPSSGEYYEPQSYYFCYYGTAAGEIMWAGNVIPTPSGVTQYLYGGATYYIGSNSYGKKYGLVGCRLYGIYRTIP